ncbi:hypothetical protein K0U83_13110 [bacterium]|nr:hypothetical protein [bacterium]
MSRVQPQTLSNEELLRHIYIYGFDNVPADWVRQLCARFADLIDQVDALQDDNK